MRLVTAMLALVIKTALMFLILLVFHASKVYGGDRLLTGFPNASPPGQERGSSVNIEKF